MNQLVSRKSQMAARSDSQRKRLYDLAHQIAMGVAGPEQLLAVARRAARNAERRFPCAGSGEVRETIAAIEVALKTHKDDLRELSVMAAPATMSDIVYETTTLLLGIPNGAFQVDLAVLTEFAIEAVAREQPCLARLLIARERMILTRNTKPSAADIVDALKLNNESDVVEMWATQGLRDVAAAGALMDNHAKLTEMLPQIEEAERRARKGIGYRGRTDACDATEAPT
ncbi:MAG: hypothetical protein JHD07_08810 [Bradyrhizobium sp.]|uniref:hypothetical protein n=1 Tax=Bradyrhizobium sp. TaxID=376 RepID=UPI001A3592E9|nr:hypothetical protein [Bradyrhizobium sp.]MBJ7403378.1 hypothetical protein [Bradyrhizobium sp.]